MSDRELLELAARAAGYVTVQYHQPARGNGQLSAAWAGPWMEVRKPEAPLGECRWNPLTNSGDALCLAVKLSIDVMGQCYLEDGTPCRSVVFPINGDFDGLSEPEGEDPVAATRRAIVRAAAEIGRSA